MFVQMITPETWDFPPPPSSVVSQHITTEEILQFIKFQPFNNVVCVSLPDCVQVPENIESVLRQDCEYYKIQQLPLQEFIKPLFIDTYVKKGKLLALSTSTQFHLEDCFAFSEGGHIILSVQKETYETLGLEGKPASPKSSSIHVISINVTDPSFSPRKKHYQRVASRFQETKLAFDVILTWRPDDERVCPSSIAEYLARAGYNVDLCPPHVQVVHKYNTRIPDLSSNKPAHVLEWMGALALDCDMEAVDIDSKDDMEVPSTSLIWKGLYSSHHIETLYQPSFW
ncbi:ribonuclease P protein subunit p40-like [Diaphorina citri]|uniref:Ribonuclease P protein subunit p40-like n=1 Tax=Diaphorina citri TaxID=121845 RepID=A0A3Q0IYD6_DIACI|nr:ribonuclease P protein subunit p40-like [Diaphorina citri]